MKKTVYLLLLCMAGILFSCSEEEISTDSQIQSKKNISFAELQKKLNVSSKISIPNRMGKGIEDFEIDTTEIVQITTEEVTTYSMKVISVTGDDGFLYSYYIYDEDGSISRQIVRFDYSQGVHYTADNISIIYDSNDSETTTGRTIGCTTIMLAIAPCVYGNWHNDDACEADGWVVVPVTICNGSGGGIYNPGGETGGTGGGAGGGSNNGGGPVTPPNNGFPGEGEQPGGEEPNFSVYFLSNLSDEQFAWLNNNSAILFQIYNYLENNGYSDDAVNFALWAVDFLMGHTNATFNELIRNKTSFDSNTGDINNNLSGGYDTASYPILGFPQILQNWPSVPNVIPANEFVGWNRNFHPNWDCMDYAKEQIRVKGYQISNYNASGQTFQIYTDQNGVNLTALSEGLSYLKYALTNGIPVIVGIDNSEGSHNPQTDNTTDHFVVIVGTGVENGEIFFRFYDNASGTQSEGTDLDNKLYVDDFLNMILGTTNAEYYRDNFTDYGYIVTQIRKSKEL